MPTTSNMNLNLPTVSVTIGPTWASQLNTALTVVDDHNHTSGKGVLIPSAGLNINDDLSFNGHNVVSPRAIQLENLVSVPNTVNDIATIAAVNDELYYIDGAGNQIQITSGGSLNAAALGAIGGDYGVSTALLAFYNINETFVFTKDTNEAAPIDCGPIAIRDIAANANSVTIKSPVGLASDYDLTLPAALPGSGSRLVQVSSTGVMTLVPTPPASNSAFVSIDSSGVVGTKFAISGNNVSGIEDLTISGTLNCNTDLIVGNDLDVTGNIDITGNAVFGSNVNIAGDVVITGTGTHSVTPEFANESLSEVTTGWTTFTAALNTVTAGNRVPTFTSSLGYYFKIGKLVFVEVRMSGTVSFSGAASFTQLYLELPVTAATYTKGFFPCGSMTNSSSGFQYTIVGNITSSSTGQLRLSRIADLAGDYVDLTALSFNTTPNTCSFNVSFFYVSA